MTKKTEELLLDELLGSDNWDDITPPTYGLSRMSYVPNVKENIHNIRAGHTTTLTKKDIEPIKESYDWKKIKILQYVHVICLQGYYKNMQADTLTFKGYRLEFKLPKTIKKKGYRWHGSYYGEKGDFHVLWRPNIWKNSALMGYARPYSCTLIIKPRQYQDTWETVKWAEEVIKMVEDKFCIGFLRLRKIELPVDCKMNGWDYESVKACEWRRFSQEAYLKTGEEELDVEDGDGTVYHGKNKKAKNAKTYEKNGYLHIEPTWVNRAFQKKKGYHRLSIYSVLLFLIEIYESFDFRYLDLGKMVESRKCKHEALDIWKIFLRDGTRLATKAIKGRCKYENAYRLFSEHPLTPFVQEKMRKTIGAGLRLVTRNKRSSLLVKNAKRIATVMRNKAHVRRLKKQLARYAIRAFPISSAPC